MKKTISLLLAVLLLLTMVSCGQSGQSKSNTEKLPKNGAVLDSESATFREELENAVREKANPIYIRNLGTVTMETLGEMEYGAFWVESFETERRIEPFMLEGDREPASYDILRMTYGDYSKEKMEEMMVEIDAKAQEIVSLIPGGADLWEKTRIVHDELCRRITYDHSLEMPHIHDAYGALVEGNAVCAGYAAAFTVVMKQAGIACPAVISRNHAWNRVQTAPSYEQYIDVTWDDRDEMDSQGNPYILHDYFGLTAEEIQSLDHHVILNGTGEMWLADPETFNYCKHEGLYLDSAEPEAVIEAFRKQLTGETNLLTLRFAREDDYQEARTWEAGDRNLLREYVEAAGYSGSFSFAFTDSLRTVNVFLNPKVK